MDNYLDQDVRIINPFNFAKSLLVQWRAVVALGLIVGILVMMGKYASDFKAVKADPVSTTVDTQTEREVLSEDISEVSASLSLAERGKVYQALAYYREIKSYENYTANSIYMNMDALDFKKVKVRYKIEPAEGVDVADVVSAYEYYFKSKDVLENITNELGLGDEPEFLSEIISVEQSGTEYMIVSIALYNTDKRDAITEIITDTVKSGEKEISDLSFQTTYISDLIEKKVDTALMANQVQFMKSYANALYSVESLSGSLSNMQKQLYNLELKREFANANEKDFLPITTVQEVLEPEGEDAVTTLRPSLAYFILGFLIGIVLYIVFYLLKALFSGRLSEMEIERETTLPVLGILEVPANKTNKVLRALFFDSLVYKRVFGDQAQKRNLENAVALMMNRNGGTDCHKIQILQIGDGLLSQGKIDELVDTAKSMGVEVVWKNTDPSNVKDVVSKIENDIPAVICAKIWKTKKSDVKKLFGMMQNQNINVLGELHIESL